MTAIDEKLARLAFEAHYGHVRFVVPWERLPQGLKDRWLRMTAALISEFEKSATPPSLSPMTIGDGFTKTKCEACKCDVVVKLDDEVPCTLCPPCGGGSVCAVYWPHVVVQAVPPECEDPCSHCGGTDGHHAPMC